MGAEASVQQSEIILLRLRRERGRMLTVRAKNRKTMNLPTDTRKEKKNRKKGGNRRQDDYRYPQPRDLGGG